MPRSTSSPRCGPDARAARTGRRPVWIGVFVETPVYDRARLAAGATLRGPAIVEERESTLVVPPGARLAIDARGNAVITLPAGVR